MKSAKSYNFKYTFDDFLHMCAPIQSDKDLEHSSTAEDWNRSQLSLSFLVIKQLTPQTLWVGKSHGVSEIHQFLQKTGHINSFSCHF